MSTEKLPEWPDRDPLDLYALAEAALARMEALVEYAQHAPSCAIGGIIGGFPTPCTCGLDALLAACERRKEAGR